MNNRFALALALFALLLAPAPARSQTTRVWQYTALGDSLAYGIDDAQGGYVARFSAQVRQDAGLNQVALINRGVPGWTSDDLLNALRTDETLRAQIAGSQVVTFNIGGNDLLGALQRYQAGTCGGADNQRCFGEAIARFKSNWNAIVAQVLSLRSTDDTVIRTMDIYNPFVAQFKFFGVFDQVKPYLDDINRHILLTSIANRIPVARVYREFNGPAGDQDAGIQRGYMSSDGIHPNAAGHEAIARTLRALAYRPLAGPSPLVGFAGPNTVFNVAESAPQVTVTVTRPSTAGAAFADFLTEEVQPDTPCATPSGQALARCDYATTFQTLYFEPGEAQKTVAIPIVNDAYPEDAERFLIHTRNDLGGGASIGSAAEVLIQDDDAGAARPNPVNEHAFFVRQQYLDFLSREPEAGEPWTGVLNNCPDVNNNPLCDRVLVSQSFFQSPEFQLKGFFVYNFYKVAFGRLPLYAEITPDMRAVTGQTPQDVFGKRFLFALAFVERPEFRATYDPLSGAQYVDALAARYALQQIATPNPANPDGAQKVTLTLADLKAGLATGLYSRAQILRAFVQSDEVNAAEFNRAFVAMQYFGYLRRDPEPTGYQAWLDYLGRNPGDYRTMVNGFVNSTEYVLRFGKR